MEDDTIEEENEYNLSNNDLVLEREEDHLLSKEDKEHKKVCTDFKSGLGH